MCDYERMVDEIREEQENKQSKEEIQELYNTKIFERLQQDLTEICNNPYLEDLKLSDDTKNTFYQNLDGWKHEFIDLSYKLNAVELSLIYKYTEFIKSKYRKEY